MNPGNILFMPGDKKMHRFIVNLHL